MKLNQPITKRDAFTLLELLIVIGFIAVLAALTASATFKIIGVQEGKTTENDLQKLYSVLDQHWKAVIAKANSDPVIPDFAYKLAGRDDLPTKPPNVERRARAIHIKLSLRQQFPVMFNELLGLNDMPGYVYPEAYKRAANVIAKTIYTKRENTERASSILLYLALKQDRGVSTDADSVFNPSNLQPIVNAAGMSYPDAKLIVDSWGNPIVFSRWPYGDLELNPLGAQNAPPFRDPQDPNGLLSDDWTQFPSAVFFSDKCYPVAKQKSFKLVPVIMSAGPDKEHGLDLSDEINPYGGSKLFGSLRVFDQSKTNDNIYTYRLRMGGSGN